MQRRLLLLLGPVLQQLWACASAKQYADGMLLLQPVDPKSLVPTWQDHGSGSALPGSAFAVPTIDLGVETWQQGNHSWANIFGGYWQSNYLDPGTFESVGWNAGGSKAYDHFTAKVLGYRSNESWQYGPPMAAAELASPADLDGTAPSRSLLALPTGFSLVGQVNKTMIPLYIWRPLAPEGYVALGDLVSNSSTAPSGAESPSVHVVRADCATPCGPAFALWALSAKGQPALSIWGARAKAGTDDISGGQFIATNISVSTEDATATVPPTLQCLAAACAAPTGMSPEQIHLALGVTTADPSSVSSMVIKWTTSVATPDSACLYRQAAGATSDYMHAVGSAQVHAPAWDRTEYLHTVELTGLSAQSEYIYRCGSQSAGVMSPPVRFRTNTAAPTIAWLGDTGNHPMWTRRTVPAIGKLVDQVRRSIRMRLHSHFPIDSLLFDKIDKKRNWKKNGRIPDRKEGYAVGN